jgi:replicative DNA helicase
MQDKIKNKILRTEGIMPPQSIDMEEAVLGAVMLENSISEVVDILSPQSFYKTSHNLIWQSILSLYRQSKPIDIMTVSEELKRAGELENAGGRICITMMTNNVASSGNIEYHARIIQQKFILREIIRISNTSCSSAYNEGADCFEVMEELEKGITEISKSFSVGKINTISSLWNEALEHNRILLTKKGISGVPSGYNNIDLITGGWQAPDLIIIAARPAMGKTSLVCNFARNAAVDFKFPGVIFSLEMSARQIATRIFSLESNVSISDFTRKGIPEDQMMHVENNCSRLINSPFFIDDTPAISISELKSKARKLKREKNIKWVVVDYLQLMSGEKGEKKGNREQEISSISRGLKALAKELEIPVIALSQLSRAVETRGGDKRPQLSDLRESGAIEQDSDVVIFIHRPEYYGVTEYEDGSDARGIAEIIFAKHRNGSTGTEQLRFINHLTKFETLESIYNTEKSINPNKNFESEKSEPWETQSNVS